MDEKCEFHKRKTIAKTQEEIMEPINTIPELKVLNRNSAGGLGRQKR